MRQIKLIIAALFLILPFAANADPIEITGTASSDGLWEITLLDGLFADNRAELESQEWWGDQSLAAVFAAALAESMGLPNIFINGGLAYGPLFAHTLYEGSFGTGPLADLWNPYQNNGQVTTCSADGPVNVEACFPSPVYATATRVSVPEPGTLALLGIGLLGMGLSRRRKRQ